jgi:hypothetical protein
MRAWQTNAMGLRSLDLLETHGYKFVCISGGTAQVLGSQRRPDSQPAAATAIFQRTPTEAI